MPHAGSLLLTRSSMLCKVILFFLFSWHFLHPVIGQLKPKKRQFRAAWVATINNIDFPSNNWLDTEEQKAEFIRLVTYHESIGINALIVQIRPAADAFFPSPFEPWSEWLNGKQGAAPQPYYDPLKFMIAESHKRNIEFHAWINPLRAIHNLEKASIEANHITKRKPEWFMNYGNLKLFNPGIPAVRAYLINLIADIIIRYDIDGVHFDDYFYPYPDGKSRLSDGNTYHAHRRKFPNKNDWRRNNINLLVKGIDQMIDQTKPYIKFGVSPFAVWRNRKADQRGSATTSWNTSYDHLCADVKLWLAKGWIDYVAPQLYQHRRHRRIPFDPILDWWTNNTHQRHLYIGHALYRVFEGNDKHWHTPTEIPYQYRKSTTYANIQGNIFYSARMLMQNKGRFSDSLKAHFYKTLALPPTMPWKDSIPPNPPQQLTVTRSAKGVSVSWLPSLVAIDREMPMGYVLYRTHKNVAIAIENPLHIYKIYPAYTTSFNDKKAHTTTDFNYAVTALDRLKNESTPTYRTTARLLPASTVKLPYSDKTVIFFIKMVARIIRL